MIMLPDSIQLGLCPPHPCSYLADQEEQIAVVMSEALQTESFFEAFLSLGFRRSGNMIYRPHCQQCNACQPIRILVDEFEPSKSQKRLLNKAKKAQISYQLKSQLDDDWYDLYAKYIELRHQNGSMYPPNKQTFLDFIQSSWLNPSFLHLYQEQKLIAVAVTDNLTHSLSAFYTFFEPEHPLSLGALAILTQVEVAQKTNKSYLYLGFQIDECDAMKYKVLYNRHQKLVNHAWQG